LADGKTVAWLTQVGEVLHKDYQEDHVSVEVRIPKRHLGKLHVPASDIEYLEAGIAPPAEKVNALTLNQEEVA
jgi:hypothetical protein